MMKELIAELSPLRMGPCCDGLDQCVEILTKKYPFTVHEFASGTECNGWTVPDKWECQVATIRNAAGDLIYDGNAHPLGVCGYSNSWVGGLGGAELKKHLYYANEYDDALIYHCDWYYKPWARDWGFSVTKNFFNSINDSDAFHVELRTTHTKGTMKVLEWVIDGLSKDSIVINAHNCHPFCCNDDLSGVAVGIQVMNWLDTLTDHTHTYRLIIAPEHFGSIFYLDRFGSENLKAGMFLESLGTQGPLALQHSFYGDHLIDRAMMHELERSGFTYRHDAFRKIVGNDETCWDSVGHEVPFPSLSRVPFPEYHTSHDGPELMDEERLQEAVKIAYKAIRIMDCDRSFCPGFKGLVCLSNPKYDLYKPMLDPSMPDRRTITDEQRRWNYFMDCVPRHIEDGMSIMEMSQKHQLGFWDIKEYLEEWREKGLIA